jgi:hypothetical protein
MANPARVIRNRVQAQHPGATVTSRGRKSITHQHPTATNKFMLDASVGPLHIEGTETEIDSDWVDADPVLDAPWIKKMVLADYNAYFGPGTQEFNAGQIIKYVHPDSGEDVTFEVQQLQWTNDLDQIEPIGDPSAVVPTSLTDDIVRWEDCFDDGGVPISGLDFEWHTQPTRLSKKLIIDSLSTIGSPPQFIIDGGNPVIRVQFIFQKSSGIEIWIDGVEWDEKANNPQSTTGNVEFRLTSTGETLWWFRKAFVVDGEDRQDNPAIQRFRKTGPNLFVEVRVPWSYLETASYPVIIDPSVEDTVAVTADDGTSEHGAGRDWWDDDFTAGYIGDYSNDQIGVWSMFTVTIPSGATIDSGCYLSYYIINDGDGSEVSKIAAEDTGTPANPTTYDEYETDIGNATTAKVDWDGEMGLAYQSSPEIQSIIAELQASYDYSSGADILMLWYDDGCATNKYYTVNDYDSSTSRPATLHIEYTESGVTVALNTATLTANGQALTLAPGAVTTGLNTATLIAGGQATTVVPGAATIALATALLTASGQALSVVPGAVTTALNTATLTAIIELATAQATANGQGISISGGTPTAVSQARRRLQIGMWLKRLGL